MLLEVAKLGIRRSLSHPLSSSESLFSIALDLLQSCCCCSYCSQRSRYWSQLSGPSSLVFVTLRTILDSYLLAHFIPRFHLPFHVQCSSVSQHFLVVIHMTDIYL